VDDLGPLIAYVAVTRYVLWNEGTADLDGTVVTKAILRTIIYVALSGLLATAMFQWGLDLAQVIAAIQMAIRAAELVIYVIGTPLVALGQMNADGGTWTAWWTNLVILSLSQAITMLAFKGFVGTTQVLSAAHTPAWLAAVARATLTIGGFGPVAIGLMEGRAAHLCGAVDGRLDGGGHSGPAPLAAMELPDGCERLWGVGWYNSWSYTC
jgi:hypothetical protein